MYEVIHDESGEYLETEVKKNSKRKLGDPMWGRDKETVEFNENCRPIG